MTSDPQIREALKEIRHKPLVLPWAMVAQDNHRLMPAHGRLISNPEYTSVKEAAEVELTRQWKKRRLDAMLGNVAVHGLVFVPDARKRDIGNYRKMITDALTAIAYEDDRQIVRETWEYGGLDRLKPRIEITLIENAKRYIPGRWDTETFR